MEITKRPEKKYKIYQKFVITRSNGGLKILQPGDIIKCTKLTAMCINTMQPMTAREIAEAKE
jgi:hypothetical protein